MLGGLSWTVKGVAILVTGRQPPVAYELGAPLFAVALLGLFASLDREDRRATSGACAAGLAIALMLLAFVGRLIAPALAPVGEGFAPLSVVQLAAALCLLCALLLLGLASRRSRRLRWSALPFWMGALLVPALLAGGALAEVDDRLLELPLVLFAIGWMLLGYSMWHPIAVDHPRGRPSNTKPPGVRPADQSGGSMPRRNADQA